MVSFSRSPSTVLLVLLACLPAACSKRNGTSAGPTDSGPVGVTIVAPEKKTLLWTIEQPGSIQPYEVVSLESKLPGHVGTILVDIEDKVVGPRPAKGETPATEGTLIAELSIPELDQEYKQKEAQKELSKHEVLLARQALVVAQATNRVAEQTVKEMTAGEKRAEANFERWKGERDRINRLVLQKVIEKETAEETQNQYVSADSAREEATARRRSSEAAVTETKARVSKAELEIQASLSRQAAAEAEFQRLHELRKYKQIRAPFDGIITARFVHQGSFLHPTGGKSEPIVTVSRIDPVRIVVDVPEAAASSVVKGNKVGVRVQSMRGAEFKGEVARTGWSFHPDLRTLRVEIDLPNPDGRIRPGMYAYASIPIAIPDTIVLPKSAIFYSDELAFCFIAEDDKAVRCQVQIGLRDADNVEGLRIKKGKGPWTAFTGKEAVIASHQGPLVDGQKVEIK